MTSPHCRPMTRRRMLQWSLAAAAAPLCGCDGRQAVDPGTHSSTLANEASVATGIRKAPPNPDGDPCAQRLHDLCGALLIYYLQHHQLPDRLADLPPHPGSSVMAANDALRMNCPVSGQPYVYIPGGIHLPERDQWILAHDPLPVHSGYRWAIRLDPPAPAPGSDPVAGLPPVVLRVIAVPESTFLFRR